MHQYFTARGSDTPIRARVTNSVADLSPVVREEVERRHRRPYLTTFAPTTASHCLVIAGLDTASWSSVGKTALA
jgi:hypothetical protein